MYTERSNSLCQMTPSAALFSAVTLCDTEDITQRWNACLQVKLAALGKVRFLAKIVEFEQGGPAFYLGLDEGWGRHFIVATGGVMVAERLHHHGPHLKDFGCLKKQKYINKLNGILTVTASEMYWELIQNRVGLVHLYFCCSSDYEKKKKKCFRSPFIIYRGLKIIT